MTTAQPIGFGFPRPGAVTAPSGPIPQAPAGYEPRFVLDGVDVTGLIFTASWRHGDQQPNRVGQVSRPADGTLFLNRPEFWSPLNPHPMVNTRPGATLTIKNAKGEYLFAGYSKGVVAASAPVAGGRPDVAVMPIYGHLQRIAEYNDGVFLKLAGGTPLITDVFRQISAHAEQAGPIGVLGDSPLRVHAPALNQAGVLSSGRNLVNILTAYEMLAKAEGGRIYDRPDGDIVFETRNHRLNADNALLKFGVSPAHAELLDPDRLIVNIMAGDSTSLQATGTQVLPTIEPMPQSITVPAGMARGIPVNLSPTAGETIPSGLTDKLQELGDWTKVIVDNASSPSDALIIENITLQPTDYTWSGSGPVTVDFDLHRITVVFDNTTGTTPQTATLKRIRGQVAKPVGGARLYARNSASVTQYGPKTARYPSNLVQGSGGLRGARERNEFVQSKLDAWVEVYSGMDGAGKPRPLYPIKVRYYPETYQPIFPSDLALLTWVTPQVEHCRDYPMWVDAVSWEIDSDGRPTVELLLSPTVAATNNPRFARPTDRDYKVVAVLPIKRPAIREVARLSFVRSVARLPFMREVVTFPIVRWQRVASLSFVTPHPIFDSSTRARMDASARTTFRTRYVDLGDTAGGGVTWRQVSSTPAYASVTVRYSRSESGALGNDGARSTFWMWVPATVSDAVLHYQLGSIVGELDADTPAVYNRASRSGWSRYTATSLPAAGSADLVTTTPTADGPVPTAVTTSWAKGGSVTFWANLRAPSTQGGVTTWLPVDAGSPAGFVDAPMPGPTATRTIRGVLHRGRQITRADYPYIEASAVIGARRAIGSRLVERANVDLSSIADAHIGARDAIYESVAGGFRSRRPWVLGNIRHDADSPVPGQDRTGSAVYMSSAYVMLTAGGNRWSVYLEYVPDDAAIAPVYATTSSTDANGNTIPGALQGFDAVSGGKEGAPEFAHATPSSPWTLASGGVVTRPTRRAATPRLQLRRSRLATNAPGAVEASALAKRHGFDRPLLCISVVDVAPPETS